jgi:hypothetical protein
MKLNKYLNDVSAVVINLKTRPDKKEYIEKQLKNRKITYSFYIVDKHVDPKRGCLESHINIIKNSNANNLLIMEDDCKFIRDFSAMQDPPPDWDMIYLGGTVHRVMDRKYKGYARVQCWTTHGYIINMKNKKLVDCILTAMNDYDGEIDRFYLEKIHPNFNAYMCDPMIALQKDGFSDIENREVSYDFMQHTLSGLMIPESYVNEDGNYVLKLPYIADADLPKVSIITPTYKRRKIFSMAIRNFENFIYPKDKIEWIIVDDSPTDYDSIEDLLPRDKRIKYIRMDSSDANDANDEPMTVAMKRNICVSNSSHPYIIHMDDDDYYPPESINARVRILLKYKDQGIECAGCTLIGTYNILNNTSGMSSDGPISLSEASMIYTRNFFNERCFDDYAITGEHKSFCEGRLNKIIDIPYSYVIIAVSHKDNITNNLRSASNLLKYSDPEKADQTANYFDFLDEETQMFIIELKNYLKL